MNLHITIENITKLAEIISAKFGISMDEAIQLAEFNLTYAKSYQEAVSRV